MENTCHLLHFPHMNLKITDEQKDWQNNPIKVPKYMCFVINHTRRQKYMITDEQNG
jgi:hypothetical protein